MLATDLADYLVIKKGLPFREAHGIVEQLSRYAMAQKKGLDQLSLAEYRKYSPCFDEDVYQLTAETSVSAKDVEGGTAPGQVEKALEQARKLLGASKGG